MRFENPNLLWLLLVIPPVLAAFFWWAMRARQKLLAQFIQARLLSALTVGLSPARQKLRFALLILAVAFLIVTLARPQLGYDLQKIEQRGLDIVVAVDTSKSMLATDIAPNRLERAKLAALELMQTAKTDRLGLVAFAGEAFLECPLTIDNTAFQQAVQALDVNTIPQGGTALAAAINTALTAFKERDHYKALVLFTDGEDNDEGALAAARDAAKAGLKIFPVGIGTAAGDMIRVADANGNTDYVRDDRGQVVKSHLNETLLKQIAAVTGGYYLPLRPETVDVLYKKCLSSLPKSDASEKLVRQYHEQFQWPLAAAALLLLAELFLPERRRVSKAGAVKVAALAAVLCALPDRAAASPASAWRDYQAGNYTNAQAEYNRLAEVHTNDLRLVFNAGVAAYRATNYDAAEKFFQAATMAADLKLQQQAYYNLGNTQYRMSAAAKDLDALQQSWEAVIKIYERAVDLDRRDADAAANLAFVKHGVAQLKAFREALRRAKSEADAAVRQAEFHRALEIMAPLQKTVAAKQFEEFTKKLKDIDAIVTPHQP